MLDRVYVATIFFVINLVISEERYKDDLHCLNVDGYKSLVSQSPLTSH